MTLPLFQPGSPRPARRQPGSRPFAVAAAAVAVVIALAGSAPRASAFGFGNPQVRSALGERLRLRIPVLAESDVELTPECLRLVNDADDPLPTISALSGTQVRIEGRGPERVLEIESRYPVNEPLIHLIVEAGCAEPVRRAFTVLLDPPTSPANPAAPATPVAPVHAAAAPPPPDLALGMPQVFAQVGRPLAMQIPVGGSAAATLQPECVHLIDALSGDGAPMIRHADILIAQNGGRTEIRLVTPHPVVEPAVRVAVSVGCKSPLQREYGVLLDMPATSAVAAAPPATPSPGGRSPALAAASLPAAAATARSEPAPARPQQHRAATSHHIRHRHPIHHARHPMTARHGGPAPAHPRALAAAAAHAPALSPRHPQPATFPGQDRFVLAAAPVDAAVGASAPDAARMAAMSKQISDLTQQIRILQTELVADRARERQLTDRQFALQSQLAARERSSGSAWVAAAAIAAALIAAGVAFWIRRRSDRDGWRRSWDAIVPEATPDRAATEFAASQWVGGRPTVLRQPVTAPPAPEPAPAPVPTLRRQAPPEPPVPVAIPAAAGTLSPTPEHAVAALPSDDELADDHHALATPTRHRIEVVELHHPTARRVPATPPRERAAGAGTPSDHASAPASGPPTDPWRNHGAEELPMDFSGPESLVAEHPATPPSPPEPETPLTQMPTMLSLDLDLSTDLTLLSDLEPGTPG